MTILVWAKGMVLRLARVPAEPRPPEGSGESVRVFHPGRNYLLWRMILWGLVNVAAALILLLAFAASLTVPPAARVVWLAVEAVMAGLFLISIPVSYFLQLLNYEMRWYIVTDRSLRIRSGVVWLQEMTMTFANIQEIRVRANPIERLLGLANLEVRSAGGGSTDPHGMPSSGHVAQFAGVDNAGPIRDLLVERLRVYRDSGLGAQTAAEADPASSAARKVLQEAQALRTALLARSG